LNARREREGDEDQGQLRGHAFASIAL
jgi:hypothetical protein